jgi:hypothetical protein
MKLGPQATLPLIQKSPHQFSVGYFDVEAGVVVRRHLRHLLRSEETDDMSWFETKGWFSSTFHVQAESQHARNIYERIRAWQNAMNE